MNNCSGHGQCLENGQCLCEPGFKGADCSFTSYKAPNQSKPQTFEIATTGSAWIYYVHEMYENADLSKVEIRSLFESPITLYIGLGPDSNPNQFNFT